MAGIKIVDLPALGRDLISTDLLELSLAGGTGSRKITGQEIMNASKLSVGNTPIINGAVGQVLFQGTGNVLQESANLFWDNTNGRLGIGISSPSTTFAIGSGGINRVNLGIQAFEMYTPSSVRTVFLGYSSTSGQLIISSGGSNDVNFLGGGFKSISTGNFAIGSTTDAGFKLDVNGTARVQGALTVSTGGVSINGNSTFVDTTTFSSGVRCSSIMPQINQNISISAAWAGSTNVTISTITNTPQVLIVQPTANLTLTSGAHDTQRILHTFAPTSGTAVINALTLNQTINQTGGASGITRGLYVNPTLTAAADFRAIETTAGNVLFGNASVGNYVEIKNGSSYAGSIAGYQNASTKRWELTNSGDLILSHPSSVPTISGGGQLRLSGTSTVAVSSGNFLIGTTTDAGYKLDVNGTARVSSRFTIGSDIIPSAAGSSVALAAHVAAGSILDLSYYTGSQNALSTTKSVIFHGITFSPSSGTAIFNQLNIAPILNQTGTANGAVRGFYYNPTVTSVLGPHWAIHTTAGRVRFEGLPTSPTGLNAGDIYNDGGTLKIV